MGEEYYHKILVVEDEEVMRKTIIDNLQSAGFKNVFGARNGEEGLEIAAKKKPDLILLDILMPRMDGIQMIQELEKKSLQFPVVILTNLDDLEHISKALSLGSFDYLIKSDWKIEDVIKRIKQKLAIKK